MSEELRSITRASAAVLGTLPGQFLALVLMNVLFIFGLFWFLNHQGDSRERVMTQLLTSCIERVK